ncbi:GDSL-type esterase/lipase family protein [Conexibacter woesei]|uniref:GDSL-type esterase/lipase family protein n=1 Tax=Conexibacter woesei TaxID=191495 RepID=UPI0003FA62F2|nr:GDSL-type esterase/lipase family protein [Conexibacter woesei]
MSKVRGAVALLSLSVATFVALPAAGGAASGAGTHWVGSWTAAPTNGGYQPLTDQTVRSIIAPHLAGSRVRVHLTNRFGVAPLVITGATIGTAAPGGGVATGTLRTLTFSGRTSVTVPAGADVVSDPVAARVRPFTKLAVSTSVSGTVAKPTTHYTTREDNYATAVRSGDHSADLSGAAFTRSATPTGWFFLEGVDVTAAARVASVVTFGDSITDGYQGRLAPAGENLTTVGKEERYPDFLQRRVDAAGLPLSILNAGISGNRVLQDGSIPIFGPRALSRVGADAIDQPGVRTVIVFEGINDIGQATGHALTAAKLIAGYGRLVARLHHAHLRVLLGTLTPAGGAAAPGYGRTADRIRVPVNRWIRRQKDADAVIDFDAAVRDPQRPSRIRPAYDGGDHLHFNAAGYRALANAVPLKQLRSR